ncbi:hypothetical protein [Halalkalibacter urbisdiaboli]|uniref:hypothetical protein n=1 Tax=Halalkalibacter urbisdiaboli TaxID=1960589 RepID=UPI000B4381FB|nr:hypothetical protein [Halalkalibacter urbisdiaboli]
MFNNVGGSSSSYPILAFALYDSDANEVKNSHDAYDVYVNEEYVGKKVLLTETEDVDDVVSFLNKQGIENIDHQLVGDHYVVKTDQADRVKEILDTYLKNR